MTLSIRLLLALAFLTSSSALAADQPDQKTWSADLKRLDALVRVFAETQAHDDQFGETFWRASKRPADERGPAIIDAVMVLSRKWQDEEELVYVPLVAFLPRGKALEALCRYQHSKR